MERSLEIERSGKYLISLFLTTFSVDVLVERILNYYPNYPTHHLYFGEDETPYSVVNTT